METVKGSDGTEYRCQIPSWVDNPWERCPMTSGEADEPFPCGECPWSEPVD